MEASSKDCTLKLKQSLKDKISLVNKADNAWNAYSKEKKLASDYSRLYEDAKRKLNAQISATLKAQ